MVIVSFAHVAVTPAGSPVGIPMPVAPLVVCIILFKVVNRHIVGIADGALTVFFGFTLIIPDASRLSHPPVNKIL